jgi:hypothetical protein
MYAKDCEESKYNTLVIDTSTALWAIVHQALTEERNRKKILEVEYFVPNLRMSALFARARQCGKNLVVTQYLRDRYVNGDNTGKQEADGWKRTEGQVDVVLWMEAVHTGDTHVMRSIVKDCRFDRTLPGRKFDDFTYMQLMAAMGL